MTKPRIGVFGIGLAAYWPQFEGLRERLEGYQRGTRGAARASSAPTSSRPGSSTRREGARAGGRAARRRPRRAGPALHGDLRDLVAGAARGAGGEGARS